MEKVEFSKIKGSICNVPIETANVCNILPRPAFTNGLILVKLKGDLQCRGNVYFEPVFPHIICQVLAYLKSHNKFYEDISVTKGLSYEDMFNFSDINENQEETDIWDGKEMSKNNNENTSEAGYASVEDLLNMHRTATNETTLISEIPSIINEKMLSFHQVKEKHQLLVWVMNFVKNKHFLIFFLRVSLAIAFLEIFQ